MFNAKLFLLLLAITFSTTVVSQNKASEIDVFMKTMVERGLFNGTVLVENNGEIIYKKAFGIADFTKKDQLQVDSVFETASITKTFTAAAVMMLAERQKLRYDDRIRKYFPELPYETITVHHLLTHTSGLPDYYDFFRPEKNWDQAKPATNADVISAYARYAPTQVFTPGTKWEYSNGGYVILASLIEKVSGQRYAEFLRKNIFEPLDMHDTNVYTVLNKPQTAKYAKGYLQPSLSSDEYYLPENVSGLGFFASTMNGIVGDGDVDSTVEDLNKWAKSFETEKLLTKRSIQQAFTPVKLHDGNVGKEYVGTEFESGYGFGWMVFQGPKNSRVVWHNGGYPGYVTHFQRNPDLKQTIVLLSNADCIFVPNIALALNKILSDRPHQTPRIPVGRMIARTAREKGVDEAIKLYHELKKTKSDLYRFRRDQLNRLGYELLAQNKTNDAIAIFKLNVDEYPQESDPYDSLGEAYMKSGDKELAIKNYEKALALDPKNQNAADMLKKLKS